MRVAQSILEKLLNDRIFRLNTAAALEISEQAVQKLAERESDNLTKYAAVLYYLSTGITIEQIFPELELRSNNEAAVHG